MAKDESSDTQQPEVTPAEAAPETAPAEPFFAFQYLDGDRKEFKTRDDLTEGFRKSYLRQREFDRDRAKFESERSDIHKEIESLRSEREHERAVSRQMLEYDRILQSDPAVYAQVQEILNRGNVSMNGQPAPAQESGSSKEIGELREELNQYKAERDTEAAWAQASSRYGDLDRGAVEEILAQIGDGDAQKMIEVLYHAQKGYSLNGSFAPSDDSVAKQTEAEKSLADLSPAGGAANSSAPQNFSSAQDAADAAYKAAGITTG